MNSSGNSYGIFAILDVQPNYIKNVIVLF